MNLKVLQPQDIIRHVWKLFFSALTITKALNFQFFYEILNNMVSVLSGLLTYNKLKLT
jgi:hypothetical protein